MLFNASKEIVKTDTQKTAAQHHNEFDDLIDMDDIFGYNQYLKKPDGKPQEPLTQADLDPFFEPGNKRRSYDLQYVSDLRLDPSLRVGGQGENHFLYRWDGSFWERLSESTSKRKAWNWLKQFAPKNATARNATALHQASLFGLEMLPAAPTVNLVPLKDYWLIIRDGGDLEIQKPCRDWGVTYQVNAQLGGNQSGHYQPAPLPADSHFFRFLQMSLPNEDERRLVQEYCGYTLLNDVRFQVAQIWVGDGCNGKSVLLKVIERLHSTVGSIRLDQLSGFGLAPLVDASLILCSEAPKRGLDEQTLKQIISGDPVAVEYKFGDMFMYSPFAKFLIACNRFPHISDDSNGVWRRLQIVRWGVNLTREQQIANLDQIIVANELKLVVDWCLEGLSRLLKRGEFVEPVSVKLRKDAEKVHSNNVLAFVDDYELDVGNAFIPKERVYEKYAAYCESSGLNPFHGVEFWKRMVQRFPGMAEQRRSIQGKRLRVVSLSFGNAQQEGGSV